MSEAVYDLLIIGGGINGVGVARDAAGRGLRVLLVEQDDLAGHTSSASSKLIHGGLRYLEHYEFRLVRESLIEREVLLRAAPHIIWPLRFVLPHEPGMRPAWMVRLGLLLYDHLGGRKMLPGSRSVDLRRDSAGGPLKAEFRKGFAYADCWVNDARLVILNAVDAAERGAEILTRTRCTVGRRANGLWYAQLEPAGGGPVRPVRARVLVNASGPWVSHVQEQVLGLPSDGKRVRLVKGSHIVVPKLYDHDSPYILQHSDGRVVFVIPYEGRYSLIGTTEQDHEGDPEDVAIDDDEVEYLCSAVSHYFSEPVRPEQAEFAYAGVRPLFDDANASASAVTRDYVFHLDAPADAAPLLAIYGGKLTTYRKLAEHALARLQPLLHFERGHWTATAHLPGGDIESADFSRFVGDLMNEYPWLPDGLVRRYARAYGTRTALVLGGARSLDGLGEDLGGGLHEAELEHLLRREWAVTDEDILWRRTKLGLHVSDTTVARLRTWLRDRADRAVPAVVQ